MNKRRRHLLLGLTLGLSLGLGMGAANAMTLSQAVNKVRRDTGGKVLSAKTEVRNNRQIHVVKVLTKDGKVRYVQVTGDPVKPRRPRG
ncbi:MAG: PepSY domain-containing protein [Lysobacterales bacterium]